MNFQFLFIQITPGFYMKYVTSFMKISGFNNVLGTPVTIGFIVTSLNIITELYGILIFVAIITGHKSNLVIIVSNFKNLVKGFVGRCNVGFNRIFFGCNYSRQKEIKVTVYLFFL